MFGYGYVRTVFRSYLCKNTCLSKILESIDKNLNNKTVADTIYINNSFNCLYKFFFYTSVSTSNNIGSIQQCTKNCISFQKSRLKSNTSNDIKHEDVKISENVLIIGVIY